VKALQGRAIPMALGRRSIRSRLAERIA
jgi:hypothetical protein